MKTNEFVKLLTPPILVQAHRALRNRGKMQNGLYLSGDYSSWGEALAASTGYDSEIILEKTRAALLKVKSGEAAYERDSVLFDEIQYAWPLLAGLMWVAAQSGGRLNVLDFGGSLGSTYFQNRRFLERLPAVRWNIIEQPAHVRVGKEFFEDNQLKFYNSIEECLTQTSPNVAIASGVLQYIEQPYELLGKLMSLPVSCVIIDRTPFWSGEYDRLCIQRIAPSIFNASYPMWIFSLRKFRNALSGATLKEEFDGFENGLFGLLWKGFIIGLSHEPTI